MRLSSLTIQGFKSFPNKIKFTFPGNVTAIVGPNGSGKSNIIDAFRWVLGGQSMKTLRGKLSPDLIFAGSNKKKRLGMGRVILEFKDATEKETGYPFKTLVLERRIYQDGTSANFINKNSVRLKDIHQLALRTNLSDESLSIISQGQTDEFLRSSSEKRLSIIEEAIGIKHLKVKKEESLKKLEEVKDNLREVRRLITEIEPNLKYLTSQKEKFDEQKELNKSYKENITLWLSYKLQKTSNDLNHLDSELKTKNNEAEILEKNIKKVKDRMEKARTSDTEKINKQQQVQELIESESEHRDKLLKETYELKSKIAEIRIESVKSIPVDKRFISEKIQSLIKEIQSSSNNSTPELKDKIITSLKKLLGNLSEGEIRIVKKDDSQKELKTTLEKKFQEVEANFKEQEEMIKKLKSDLRQISEEMNKKTVDETQLLKDLEYNRDKQHSIDRELDQLNYKKGNLENEQQNIIDEIQENKVKIIKKISLSNTEAQQLEALVKNLKNQLRSIGYVDDTAIEEFEKVNERFNFLTEQLNDLIESRKETKEIIIKLDEEINNKFTKSFEKINSNFDKLFQKMFGGGEAHLQLVQDDEKEKMGVEIQAKIPRKKVANITLFSGGERALTSIALTLSLVYTSPPPFIVLDEVDAALDDSNSFRFSNIVTELAKKSQIIMVTHNHETMQKANVLYGISMNSDGYSNVNSLSLEEIEN